MSMSSFVREMEKLYAQLDQLNQPDRQINNVKRNHHLPRYFLKGFARLEGRAHFVRRIPLPCPEDLEGIPRISISDAGVRKNLYPQELEDILSVLDNTGARWLNEVVHQNNTGRLRESDKAKIALSVLLPLVLRSISVPATADAVSQALAGIMPETEKIPTIDPKHAFTSIFANADATMSLLSIMAQRKWLLLRFESNVLLCPDTGTSTVPRASLREGMSLTGWSNAAEMAVPLSASSLLVMTTYKHHVEGIVQVPDALTKYMAAHWNNVLAMGALQFAYCHPESVGRIHSELLWYEGLASGPEEALEGIQRRSKLWLDTQQLH